MPVILGKNINAERIIRQLGDATQRIGTVFERLSSGLRINSASDDAAGLAVATDLQVRARIANQGIRNVNDGISFLSIAEGAVSSLVEIITRQKELAEQAANGSYSLKQRQALDKEARALTDEYNRIVASTSFNGINVLGARDVVIQSGIGVIESTQIGIGNQLATVTGGVATGTGTFTVAYSFTLASDIYLAQVETADLNGDGNQDIVIASNYGTSVVYAILGNGNGTFSAPVSYDNSLDAFPKDLEISDFDGDGILDLVTHHRIPGAVSLYKGNGDGTFQARRSITIGGFGLFDDLIFDDVNNDGFLDVIQKNELFPGRVFLNDGSGGLGASIAFGAPGYNIASGDVNNDGNVDVLSFGIAGPALGVALGNGNGTFATATTSATSVDYQSVISGDLNNDGADDVVLLTSGKIGVLLSNGNGTFQSEVEYSSGTGVNARGAEIRDLNGDSFADIVVACTDGSFNVFLNNGNGSFAARRSLALPATNTGGAALADFNGDGALDAVVIRGDNSSNVIILNGEVSTSNASTTLPTISDIDLTTVSTARAALEDRSTLLNGLGTVLGTIGAYQSRLQSVVRRLQSTSVEYEAARHRIIDADVASETATLVAQSVRREVASSLLAQANLQGDIVLKLIRG